MSDANLLPRLTKDNCVQLFQDPKELKLIPGEKSVAILSRVEDVKAHPGQFGQGQITNIRFIWYIQGTPTVNTSIGYHTVVQYKINNFAQNVSGGTETLSIKAKQGAHMFEFIFSVSKANTSIFKFFEIALKNYENSSFYREQRLRSAIFNNGSLRLLQGEQVMLQLDGLSNFSNDVAKIGSATITNMRYVWSSEIVSNFNVSIPLIILPPFKLSESKRFGKCFYLKLYSGGVKFMYGFTLKPEERLIEFLKSAEKIRISAVSKPILTPPIRADMNAGSFEKFVVNKKEVEEEFKIDELDKSLLYLPYDESAETPLQGITFNKQLGLSIEELPKNTSMTSKWVEASNTPLVAVDEL